MVGGWLYPLRRASASRTSARWLGGDVALVRAMPNRPALIGRGITALCAAPGVKRDERARAEQILAATGETLWIESEPLLDVVTAVSGSGPAYFFLLMEALEDAGRAHGLSADIARRLAVVTAAGAGEMAAGGDASPAMLREQVTSQGRHDCGRPRGARRRRPAWYFLRRGRRRDAARRGTGRAIRRSMTGTRRPPGIRACRH